MSDDLDAHHARARQALANVAAVVPHPGADGLAAGAIALRARGERAAHAVLLGLGRTPWEPDAPLPDGPPALLGWGMRPLEGPALVVDHHAPEAAPGADQVFVTGYGEQPEPSTAALMRRIVPAAPAWLAAVGAFRELGRAGLELPEAAERRADAVRRLAGLVDAPRRLPDGPVAAALELLVEHEDPRGALADARTAELAEAKRVCRAECERAMRIEPTMAGAAAIVRLSSPCAVQSLVATAWSRRMGGRLVVAANDGCLPGRVAFAACGGPGSVVALLRGALAGAGGERGGDDAAGGVLAPEAFARLLAGLGLDGGAVGAAGCAA